jgi:cysteinyl-tRNA synthetase
LLVPDFRLYNTLSRAVEPFAPADGKTVCMYSCGPTIYDPAHLGNFRTFVFTDVLRRTLKLAGWSVNQVMNLTDVDDKIIARAQSQSKTIGEVTAPIELVFHANRKYLRIQDAEHYPRATAYIQQMIALVERLLAKNIAYRADDGSVYFAITRFPTYGKLSRLDTRDIRVGARVAQDDYTKDNAQDFALWKAAKPEDEAAGAAWDAPFGRGRPGWHLECSAMAMSILGETIDLHTGGVDLLFPHHEDEIAQSEAATGHTFARCWCHGEFLLTDGSKMAKREGNVASVGDLERQSISAAAVRHFFFTTHYRKQLNLSTDALAASGEAVRRIGDFASRLGSARTGTPALGAAAAEASSAFRAALFDDLNAPEALAVLFTFIKQANAELDRGGADAAGLESAKASFAAMDGVLDIVPEAPVTDAQFSAEIEAQLAERQAARRRKDFAAGDAIRKSLRDKGIEIEDTPEGTKWKQVRPAQ